MVGAASSQVLKIKLRGFGMLRLVRSCIATEATAVRFALWPSALMGAASSQVLKMKLRGFGMLRLVRSCIATEATAVSLFLWPSVLMGAASSQVLMMRGFGMLRLTRLRISIFVLKNVLVAFVHSVQVLIFLLCVNINWQSRLLMCTGGA